MMKRRNIIMVMMMSLLLGSCSSEDILSVPNGNGRIRFDVGVSQSQEVMVTPMNGGATRSAEPLFLPTSSIEMHSGDMTMYANCASTADIPMHNIIPETTTRGSIQTEDNFYSTFGIFGYFYESNQSWTSINKSSISPESSMNNLKVTRDNYSWTTDVYWPGGTKKATFFAYAPHNSNVELTSNTGAPKITYTVPSKIANQQDLLIAKSDVDISCNGKSAVALTFEHALTAIKFSQGDLGDYTKITSIKISGVNNKGELSLDGASWGNLSTTGDISYTILSQDGITLNDVLLLLMPQTLPDGAKLEVKMSNADGTNTKVFSADLTGDWQKGYTVTYQLSVNKIFGDYVLEITPNTKVFDENGGEVSMTVTSYFEYSDGSSQIPVPWTTVSYAYADGTDTRTPIDKALTGFSVSSNNGGSTGESITATIGKQYFKSDKTWNAAEKGTESEPFDLSKYDPSSSTHELATAKSANCYVVNAPGWYKIPLYYGNSLNNSNGYGSETFQNHVGTKIDESNCKFSSSVTSGKLLWQDEYALITPSSIKKDGDYLKFYVSPDAIAQGNAVIAALNSSDQILWSWHIWVTDMDLTKRVNVLSGSKRDTNYPFMTQPVGYCEASTLRYPQRDFIVTIKQGTSCKLAAAKISQQSETTQSVAQNCTFYQWGRKDPFPGAQNNGDSPKQKLCYKADGSDFVYEKKGGNTELGDGKQTMAGSILNPTTFYYSKTASSLNSKDNDWCSTTYYDNWSMIDTSINGIWADDDITKTVYDPCPIGFKMPGCNAFTRFTTDGENHFSNDDHTTCSGDEWKNQICVSNKDSYERDKGWSFYTQADDTGETDFWYAFGFIECWFNSTYKGYLSQAGYNGDYWSARAYSAGEGCSFYFTLNNVKPRIRDRRAYGFPARPVSEQ